MTAYTQELLEIVKINDSYSKPDQIFICIYDGAKWVEVEGVSYFKIEKRLNQMSKFSIDMPQIETAQKVYVKEFAKVMLFSNNVLILKGRIQKMTYETSNSAKIEGLGMEATILDKEFNKSTAADPDRVQYDNVSAQTIAKELLSTSADGLTPWTMTPRSSGLYVTDYGQISMRFEYANKLTALASLADTIKYDWWIDHDPISYTNDYFNMASIKGNQTTPTGNRAFTITGDYVNAEGTNYQRDVSNIANYVKVNGYGDGINQINTTTYNASPTWTTLATSITAASTSIVLTDASAFAASGTIRIMEEIITYTGKSTNTLTGCTRGTSSTTARIHKANCYVEKYVASTSPEATSSIYVNGLMELTLNYKDVRDLPTLELIASNELISRMSPIERIIVKPTDPSAVAENVQTGDLISIIDAESSLNSNYRVVGIIYENNYGFLSVTLEASNKSLTFIEQLQKEREKNQALQKYMQGSTNVYVNNSTDNCDNGFNLILKSYIPPATIAINAVKLSYSVSSIRTYSGTNANESAHRHGIPTLAVNSHTHPIPALTVSIPQLTVNGSATQGSTSLSGGYTHSHSITNLPAHQHLMFTYNSGGYAKPSLDKWVCSRASMSGGTTAYFWSDATYNIYTDGSAVYQGVSQSGNNTNIDHQHSIPSLTVNGTSTQTSTTSTAASTSDGAGSTAVSNTTQEGSAHTHGVSFGIITGSNTVSDMTLWINSVDRTAAVEAALGHALSINSTEQEINLTAWITTGWNTIELRPNGTCRIAAEMYNQVFIESK